jgi:glucokinase
MNASNDTVTAGVDLGGTKIQTVVMRGGQVVGSCRIPTPQTGAAGDVIEAILATVRSSLEDAEATAEDLGGVGIGSPGNVDARDGSVSLARNVPGFGDRVALGPTVSERLGGATVVVDNDVAVGVRGEASRGAGRPYKNLLGVWVGTGVGGGLIIDGELYDGRGGAGEFGHMVAKPDGRRCTCGRHGCVEAYAGRASMEHHARHLMERGEKTDLFRIMKERDKDRLSSSVYARALESGDPMAIKLIGEAAWALGLGIASAQNLLDLEAIIVGGGLGDRLGRPFIDSIAQQMLPHLFVPDHAPVVLSTELQDLAGAIGAAVLAGG